MSLATDPRLYPEYGRTARLTEIDQLILSENEYPQGLTIPTHAHETDAYFNLVLSGGYAERAGSRDYKVGPAALVAHPVGAVHSNRIERAGTRLFNLTLTPSWLRRIEGSADAWKRSTIVHGGLLVGLATQIHGEFLEPDEFSGLVVHALALQLVAQVSRVSSTRERPTAPRWLNDVKAFLDSHCTERVSLSQVAAVAGVHEAHLSRVFRQAEGGTIGEYLRERRVRVACDRLRNSRAPLRDIALETGFADQSHMTRAVHRWTGLTPARFRLRFGTR